MKEAIRKIGRAVGIGFVEFLVVGRFAPLKFVVRRAIKKKLATLAPHFDRDIYLRQIRLPSRCARAAHDPLLHYVLVGWRESRSPNARFDPVFIGNDMRAMGGAGEPLADFLTREDRRSIPQNEVEAARGLGPSTGAGREAALIFHHGRGGGSSKFLNIFEQDLREEGFETLRLRLLPKSDRLVIWPGANDPELLDLFEDGPRLLEKARAACVKTIVISHVIDLDALAFFDLIDRLKVQLDARVCIILHDYFCVCPRVNLVDWSGRPCPIPDASVCVACVAQGGSETRGVDPVQWRQRFLEFLKSADRIVVPSGDLRQRLARFTDKSLEVWRPQCDASYAKPVYPPLRGNQKLSVAVLGSLNGAKGSGVVLDLARRIARSRAPIAIEIYGETDLSRKLRGVGVAVKGRYRDSDVETLLRSGAPHIVLMPAIWPETWSFILTTALECNLHVMAFAHGAQAERLMQLGRSDLLLPVDWIDKPDRILDALLAFRAKCLDVPDPIRTADISGRNRP